MERSKDILEDAEDAEDFLAIFMMGWLRGIR